VVSAWEETAKKSGHAVNRNSRRKADLARLSRFNRIARYRA